MTVSAPSAPSPTPTPTGQPPSRPGVTGALTRKIGPLPVWMWAVVIGGAGLMWRLTRKGGTTTVQQIPVGTGNIPSDTTGGFINELSVALKRLEDGMAVIAEKVGTPLPGSPPPNTQPPAQPSLLERLTNWEKSQANLIIIPPEYVTGGGLPLLVMRLRRALGMNIFTPSKAEWASQNVPGETAENRARRLGEEATYLTGLFNQLQPISAKPS